MIRRRVQMPLARLGRTLLVIGAPGSGKTVTLGRLAYGVALTSDLQVIVLDAKGDPAPQQAFAAAMHAAGRSVRLFPQEPYDAWRGDGSLDHQHSNTGSASRAGTSGGIGARRAYFRRAHGPVGARTASLPRLSRLHTVAVSRIRRHARWCFAVVAS